MKNLLGRIAQLYANFILRAVCRWWGSVFRVPADRVHQTNALVLTIMAMATGIFAVAVFRVHSIPARATAAALGMVVYTAVAQLYSGFDPTIATGK